MKAVSNTTPLRYLIAIDQHHLLEKLFQKVFVPVAVHDELTDMRTPAAVRRSVLSSPSWLEVRPVSTNQETAFRVSLHEGEREAILLMEELRADVLLIDDQDGRAVALDRKLPISGTLGVLEQADRMSLMATSPNCLSTSKRAGSSLPKP